MTSETWVQIDGWPLYDVSNHGHVRSWNSRGKRRAHPKQLKGRPDSKGYQRVTLCDSGRVRDRFIHQLVLEAFVGSRPTPDHEGRHGDGNQNNNRSENLSWSTHADNMRDQYRHGTRARGSCHGMAILTESDVLEVRSSSEQGKLLAARFGVSRATISKIRSRKSWTHITE